MWFTISFKKYQTENKEEYKGSVVTFNESNTIVRNGSGNCYRTSQIFPLHNNTIPSYKEKYFIFFYNYSNQYALLGKVIDELDSIIQSKIWYSLGLSSIILITDNYDDKTIFEELIPDDPRTYEEWTIDNCKIEDFITSINNNTSFDFTRCEIKHYNKLNVVERSTIDEFVSAVDIIIPQIAIHNPEELETFYSLIENVNELINELVYVTTLEGTPPDTIIEYSTAYLENHPEKRIEIKHQNIERIVQINSALSYISTQMLSGAVPILERRSLIRRYSLLGVGSAIHSLNKLTREIERIFSSIPLKEIINNPMNEKIVLKGSEKLLDFENSSWSDYSLDNWRKKYDPPKSRSVKIPFFSGRFGFRETEYTMSAAIQCLTAGATIEWNLITITHEMMHSHVRDIIAAIFYGDKKNDEIKNRKEIYDILKKHLLSPCDNLKLIDYIRNLFGLYIVLSYNRGSISNIKQAKIINDDEKGLFISDQIKLMPEKAFWEHFEREYRNMNEIIVHVLDFHYFYIGRIESFVPIVLKSWSSLPFVKGDILQYIMRVLLVVSCSFSEDYISKRFESSIKKMLSIIEEHIDGALNHPLIHQIKDILIDQDKYIKMLNAFSSSVVLVDLANKIFFMKSVQGELYDDENVMLVPSEKNINSLFTYSLPDGFNNAKIARPAAFLLDKYINQLSNPNVDVDIEKNTAIYFLACNSH